jgi:sugar O-acyltransferase (sialic acid O-acetyltransferase NeuD family)
MKIWVRVPQISVNEEEVNLIEWRKNTGERVEKGDVICVLESSKAVLEMEAEASGYLTIKVKAGERVKTGEVLAVLSDSPNEKIFFAPEEKPPSFDRRWTKKAEFLAKRLGVDLEKLWEKNQGKTIMESDVLSAANKESSSWVERVLILGGGSAAVQILDLLARLPGKVPVGILDDDDLLHGGLVMGVKVLGKIESAFDFWKERLCDSMVVALGFQLEKREALFSQLSEKGVVFSNFIDPTADIHLGVKMGRGNVVLAHSYFGPCVEIGNNNFFSSFTCLEHHTQVGSHCLFGPSVSTSGYVSIGNKVRLGTHVGIEPQVHVGDGAHIASGSILTHDVPAGSVVKAHLKF